MARITTHPGEVLATEFLAPLGLSARALADRLHVPANRVTAVINGDRSVTADTAIRLSRYFGTSPEFWLNLQQAHDLSKALQESGYEDVRARDQGALVGSSEPTLPQA